MNKKTKQFKIKPRGLWVLVKPLEKDSRENEYGIIVPDSVEKEQKAQGTIIELGDKVEGLKKGQKILYGMYAGEPIQIGSQHEQKDRIDYILLLEEDILAILE